MTTSFPFDKIKIKYGESLEKGGKKLKERRLDKKKDLWIKRNLEKWNLFSYLLIGDKHEASILVKNTVQTIKDRWIFFPKTQSSIKPLLKAYRKFIYKDHTYYIHKETPLLNQLSKLHKEDRVVLLLKYVMNLSDKEIKKVTRKSERKIKERVYRSLTIWTEQEKLTSLKDLRETVSKELAVLHLREETKENIDLVVAQANVIRKGKVKRRFFVSVVILCLFFIGGTLNEKTIQVTRLGAGPDIYEVYINGGVYDLQNELSQQGYKEAYVDPNYDDHSIGVYTYTSKEDERKEEILAFIEDYLKKKDLDYSIHYEFFNDVEVDAEVEEEDASLSEVELQMKKENEMLSEIYEVIQKRTTLYGVYFEEDDWKFTIVDHYSSEEEKLLVEEIKGTMKKYDLVKSFSFQKISSKKVEIEENCWPLYNPIAEAFHKKEKYQFENIAFNYDEEKDTLEVEIYTSLYHMKGEGNEENKELAKEMKRSLAYFLSQPNISKNIQNVPFHIKVFDVTEKEVELN